MGYIYGMRYVILSLEGVELSISFTSRLWVVFYSRVSRQYVLLSPPCVQGEVSTEKRSRFIVIDMPGGGKRLPPSCGVILRKCCRYSDETKISQTEARQRKVHQSRWGFRKVKQGNYWEISTKKDKLVPTPKARQPRCFLFSFIIHTLLRTNIPRPLAV